MATDWQSYLQPAHPNVLCGMGEGKQAFTCLSPLSALGRGADGGISEEAAPRVSCFGFKGKAIKAKKAAPTYEEASAMSEDSVTAEGYPGHHRTGSETGSHNSEGCHVSIPSRASNEDCSMADSRPPHGLQMHDSTHSMNQSPKALAKYKGAQHVELDESEEDDIFLQPEWEIDPHDIYFCSRSNGKLCRLGKGAFGTVYKGVWNEQMVAVKVCKQQHVNMKNMKCFQKEVAILHGCQHPNIVDFIGACCWKGGKRTVLVTEFMEKGDLSSALGRAGHKFVWNRLGRSVALDVARGLAFLHSRNIVHFDLKSANILLDRHNRAKLADVGLAKTLTHYHGGDTLSTYMATGDLGTFSWAAPEVLLGMSCAQQADIYSFGVVLWELATTEMPQGRCLRPIRVPEEAPQEVAELALQCLRHDPASRPTAAQLVQVLETL